MEATWWTKPDDLDEEQKGVIALDKDSNHLVCGPPGCGKTNLLLLRAGYMHRIKRRNFVVLTYGRVLKEFLATGAVHYPFSADRILTYTAWASRLSAEHGLVVPKGTDEPVLRAALLKNLQSIIASGKFTALDCLLVDEVQDYTVEELDAMISLANQVFLVGDDRQEIYGDHSSIGHLRGKLSSVVDLTIHYRNGIKICRVADAIFNDLDSEDGLESSSQYDEMEYQSSVICRQNLTLDEQIDAAVGEIKNQLIAYPTGYIGVMCPRNVDLDAVSRRISQTDIADSAQLQKFAEGYHAFDPERRVIMTTMHGAKGLEFRAVHILAGDTMSCFHGRTKRVAYTAVTRAKTYLAVYSRGALPGFLDRAIADADEEPAAEPGLDELFTRE